MNFLNDSKYAKWYISIISQFHLKTRKKREGLYYEKHHIIPKSLGGDNSKSNLVLLTAREHFICHLLLTKACKMPDDRMKMICAATALVGFRGSTRETIRINSKLYKSLREQHGEFMSKLLSNIPKTDAHRDKISQTRIKQGTAKGENNPMHDKNHSETSLLRMSQIKQGMYDGEKNPMFGKEREDLRQRNLTNNPSKSPERRKAMSEFAKARKGTNSPLFGISKPKLTCPHCGKVGAGHGIMSRWHFDNCRQK